MRCFTHLDVEAVGICGNCRKGLCRPCAAEGGWGLTCVGACAKALMSADRARGLEFRTTARRLRRSAGATTLAALPLAAAALWLASGPTRQALGYGMAAMFAAAWLQYQFSLVFGTRANVLASTVRPSAGGDEMGGTGGAPISGPTADRG